MQTPEFKGGIDRLILLAADQQTVIMCAEAYLALSPIPHLRCFTGSAIFR